MARRAAKIDAIQPEIVAGLEAAGATVQSLAPVGNGCPDLLVGYRGVNFIIEVKDGSLPAADRKLNPKQKTWHAAWRGKAHVANTLLEALMIIGAAKAAN